MNRHHHAELEQRLTDYDTVDLRAMISALDWADWHIAHPELCSVHVPGLEEHTKRAQERLAAPETGRAGAAEGTASARHGGGCRG